LAVRICLDGGLCGICRPATFAQLPTRFPAKSARQSRFDNRCTKFDGYEGDVCENKKTTELFTDGCSRSEQRSGDSNNQASALIKTVRESTERFKDVAAAQRAGYGLQFGCVSGPDSGAMGMHFVNFPLVMDGILDATRPEIVIYEPQPDGRLRLIGADYLVLADAWNASHSGPPQLMGQLFHYFEAPNRFGLPAFYTLHVWAWKENPTGAFVN
jgi:hypothetical protein